MGYLLCGLLLQMNDLILPVDPLGLQLAGQQVRVLQTTHYDMNPNTLTLGHFNPGHIARYNMYIALFIRFYLLYI